MTDPVLIALIPAIALIVVAFISGLFLRNNRNNHKSLNPIDPDKTLVGRVSVGWLMDKFEERMTNAVAEGLRRDRDSRR